MELIHLAQNKLSKRTLVNTILGFHKRRGTPRQLRANSLATRTLMSVIRYFHKIHDEDSTIEFLAFTINQTAAEATI